MSIFNLGIKLNPDLGLYNVKPRYLQNLFSYKLKKLLKINKFIIIF
jgi:hypothetical protein